MNRRDWAIGKSRDFELESLEARIVLSSAVSVAGVGVAYDTTNGFAVYVEEGTWNADRSVSAQRFVASDSGAALGGDSNLTDLIIQPDGQLKPIETASIFDQTFATRFDSQGGYASGWYGGFMNDASATELSTMIERPVSATTDDLTGTWSIQLLHVTSNAVYVRNGTLSIGGTSIFLSVLDRDVGDPILAEGGEITSVGLNGKFSFQMGNGDTGSLYLSADGSTLLLADLDTGDGDSAMGVAVITGSSFSQADLAGSYRAGIEGDGASTVSFFGDRSLFATVDLNADSTMTLMPMDTPNATPTSGTWSLSGGTITVSFDDFSNITMEFRVSADGKSLVPVRLRDTQANTAEQVIGMVTLVQADPTPTPTTLAVGIFDLDGTLKVFDLHSDDSWSVVDPARYAIGEVIGANPSDIEAFTTSSDLLFAAISTDDGVFVAQRDTQGFWTSVNLTTAVSNAVNITSNLTVFTDLKGVSYIAGLTDAGDMVTYQFDPTAAGGPAWSFENISQTYLVPQGMSTPVFSGPLISYVTSWNGLNIAGLDANGDIQAVWSGNGGKDWFASNLSDITGAPKIASGLTAYLTSWDGINIVGLDDNGSVLATWWVPSFGGNWQVSDLTAIAQGPALVSNTLTSFVAPWGGLNIAGIDAGGDVIAYWWSPSLEKQGKTWQVANLTEGISTLEPKPTEQLTSQTNTTHGGEMNILGTDKLTGNLIRLFYRVDTDVWAVENATLLAEYV